MSCNHIPVQHGYETCFSHCVAVEPHTTCNPAAHGGITYRQHCVRCCAVRRINVNCGRVEYGPWKEANNDRLR